HQGFHVLRKEVEETILTRQKPAKPSHHRTTSEPTGNIKPISRRHEGPCQRERATFTDSREQQSRTGALVRLIMKAAGAPGCLIAAPSKIDAAQDAIGANGCIFAAL